MSRKKIFLIALLILIVGYWLFRSFKIGDKSIYKEVSANEANKIYTGWKAGGSWTRLYKKVGDLDLGLNIFDSIYQKPTTTATTQGATKTTLKDRIALVKQRRATK